jgi:hypothetical protein
LPTQACKLAGYFPENGDHLMEHNTLSDDLNDELKAITEPLVNVMIVRKISPKDMLLGIHAFLMALQASGNADAGDISEELSRMADYYRSLVLKH